MTKYIFPTLALILGIICFCLWIRPPKVVKEVRTVIKTQTVDKLVYKDRVIDRKIYIDSNGTVVTTEHEVIKDREVEKIVEKVVEKEVTKYKNSEWILSLDYQHYNGYPDGVNVSIAKQFIGGLYLSVGYSVQLDPNFLANPRVILHYENVSVGLKLLF